LFGTAQDEANEWILVLAEEPGPLALAMAAAMAGDPNVVSPFLPLGWSPIALAGLYSDCGEDAEF
jgi:hypothetical protein